MLIKSYKDLLKKHEYLPLEKWKSGKVEHHIEKIKNHRKPPQRERILEQGKGIPGVYAYFLEDVCLYVGEAGDIGERLAKHYDEAWGDHSNWKKQHHQYEFFKLYRYELDVKWLELENEFDRKAIEAMCTRIFNPIYIDFRKGLLTKS